jgi:uncharacterized RDD family membrane protein YckC
MEKIDETKENFIEENKKGLFKKRIFAFLIDILLINIVIITPFQSVIFSLIPEQKSLFSYFSYTMNFQTLFAFEIITNYILLFSFFYFVLMEYSIGQTIGKIMLGIKVVSEKNKLGFFQSMGRNFFLFPLFPSLIFLIDIIYMFFRGKGYIRFTEMITKTKIIIIDK